MTDFMIAATSERLVSDADHVKLSRLFLEHAYRTDHGRADTLCDPYTDDGELVLQGATLHGHDVIRLWGQQIVAAPPWRCIRHCRTNMRFVATGENEAEGISMLTVYMVAGSDKATTVPRSVGEDHDRFVRTERGWRFARREWVELFARGDMLAVA
jgi:hypothetical protein